MIYVYDIIFSDVLLFLLFSRIRTEQNGGAWCPKQQITREVYEYLQVDLKQLTVITLVETQGRFGNGQVSSFLTSYLTIPYIVLEAINYVSSHY